MLRPLWARAQPPGRAPKRRRGGWRQRLDDSEDERDDQGISFLASGLLQEWADGLTSAVRLQRHMANAARDGFVHPMVQTLAQLGEGKHAHANLVDLLGGLGLRSLQTKLDAPDAVTDMMLPSTMLRLLHQEYPQRICKTAWGGLDQASRFLVRVSEKAQNTRVGRPAPSSYRQSRG